MREPGRGWRTLAPALAALALALAGGGAAAQSLEGVLMPGPVIADHAKVEQQCRKCHVPFDRAAQDLLCRDCHKEVDADLRARRGYHGRLAPQPCRGCHTDHKGRDARIARVDARGFDHAQTDFALRNAHAAPALKCESCHRPGDKYRAAAVTCNGCHQQDDVHKGRLGAECAQCHTDLRWKDVSAFDHDRSRFPLRNKHVPVKCEGCHRDDRFKDTPLACIGCHRKDDTHKTRYGDKCEACHDDRAWKPSSFDHDRDTRYPLRGRHAAAKCESCHAGQLYRDKLSADCFACHQKDDKHQGTLGRKCGDCHTERNWTVPKFDHAATRFPLRGKHLETECKSCHKSPRYKEAESTCVGCHRQDDQDRGHKGRLGEACGDCHTERNWKDSRFDHDRTRFALQGKHRTARCETCHQNPDFKRTPLQCLACHRKEDRHEGQLGAECGDCHGAASWKTEVRFDHARSRFPLVGGHLKVACAKCHATPRYKDAKGGCVDCHDKDDKHRRRLGPRCADCHNARAWSAWDFNHDRQTRFALDGAHRRLACESCHARPVRDKATLPAACVACHRGDDVHDGGYGPDCQRCHGTGSFREIKRHSGAAAGRDWLAAWFEPGRRGRRGPAIDEEAIP